MRNCDVARRVDCMLGALNGDFKRRKAENLPNGLVNTVGDILVQRVR